MVGKPSIASWLIKAKNKPVCHPVIRCGLVLIHRQNLFGQHPYHLSRPLSVWLTAVSCWEHRISALRCKWIRLGYWCRTDRLFHTIMQEMGRKRKFLLYGEERQLQRDIISLSPHSKDKVSNCFLTFRQSHIDHIRGKHNICISIKHCFS